MTKREAEILSLIEENPMITQLELATRLGISRSSVAVHISNLMAKGFIRGRGYVLKEDKKLLVVGGVNIDYVGKSQSHLLVGESNPGLILKTHGGVARNIAENLARMGIKPYLLTAIGVDSEGDEILQRCRELGVHTERVKRSSLYPTSTYMALLNEDDDLHLAISSMDVMEEVSEDYLKQNEALIIQSDLIVADGNIPENSWPYLAEHGREKLFVDPVSQAKAKHLIPFLDSFYMIKPNRHELEVLSSMEINTGKDLESASDKLLEKGVNQVLATAGDKGSYFASKDLRAWIKLVDPEIKRVNGAGDAMFSAYIKSQWLYDDPVDRLRFTGAYALFHLEGNQLLAEDLDMKHFTSFMDRVDIEIV